MVTLNEYSGLLPAWCPGCGNFGILMALKKALVEMGLEPHQVLLVSDIGQAGKLPHYIQGNVFNSLHGRAIPPALGAKIANTDLKVIVIAGDGGAYGEGGNHFIHAARRNHDVTYLVHDNQVYGLTKGQASPTSEKGFRTRTTPEGAPPSFNPLLVALAMGAGFVARGFAGDVDHLAGIIRQGIEYKGFALIDIFQPCISFNQHNTFAWFRERVYKLDADNHNPSDRSAAFARSQENDRLPIGIFYREERPTYEESLPALKKGLLVDHPYNPRRVETLFTEFI